MQEKGDAQVEGDLGIARLAASLMQVEGDLHRLRVQRTTCRNKYAYCPSSENRPGKL